jgi:PiT family inorganic phosphate transporter
MGAGLGRKGGVVRWSTATRMFVAWGLTLPAAGLVGAGAEFLTKQGPWGITLTAILLVGGSFAIWLASRRQPVDHTNVNDSDGADEPQGVVTTAIAAVQPPPVGGPASDLATTIPAPASAPDDPARPPATV